MDTHSVSTGPSMVLWTHTVCLLTLTRSPPFSDTEPWSADHFVGPTAGGWRPPEDCPDSLQHRHTQKNTGIRLKQHEQLTCKFTTVSSFSGLCLHAHQVFGDVVSVNWICYLEHWDRNQDPVNCTNLIKVSDEWCWEISIWKRKLMCT